MTSATNAKRLKEAYRVAMGKGLVARNRDSFRYGRIVRFVIEAEPSGFGIDEGVASVQMNAGEFQLQYVRSREPAYGVLGRLDGSKSDADWVLVDGPWPVDKGPFDNPRRRPGWEI